ncbi:MAG: plastocyanin/azurin family copper-binding protein [Vicinamibacterales bacterium]
MKRRTVLGFALLLGLTLTSAPLGARQAARIINLTAGDPVNNVMNYSVKTLRAKAGERVRVRLTNIGQTPKIVMAHNFVLLKEGVDPKAFTDAAAAARDTDYILPSQKNQIIANTTMAGPGERVEVTFVVPTKPGKYTFVCTFAGHYAAGMWGELIVQ